MDLIKINYIELQSHDLETTMAFYSDLFGWTFTRYGRAYISFDNAGIEGGFFLEENPVPGKNRTVLFSQDLDASLARVLAFGVELTRPIYEFPGGKRFEFDDPTGNPLAIWTKTK